VAFYLNRLIVVVNHEVALAVGFASGNSQLLYSKLHFNRQSVSAILCINFYLRAHQMLFDWFDTKQATVVGIKLAEDLSKELTKVNNKHAKQEANRAKVIQKVFSQIVQLKQKTKLNFYQKSKLINEFTWKLNEIGHDKDFVRAMTKELVICLK
jgi:hypothetical protein